MHQLADMVDPAKRSEIMGRIKGEGNRTTEWRLRAYMIREGLNGWRVQASDLLGKPDFVFPAERLAVFVDGCFWHGCPECSRPPRSNRDYWNGKLNRNKARDQDVNAELRRQGWRVARFWEHEVQENPYDVLESIREQARRPEIASDSP